MTRTKTLQKQLSNLWTTQDLTRVFRRTAMTIYLWRTMRGLPSVGIDGDRRGARRYVPDDVRRWARQNGEPMYEGKTDVKALRHRRTAQNAA